MRDFKNSNMFQYDNSPPAVQEVVSTGRVTEVAVPVQDFKAIKPDIAIKGTRATKEVITIKGISSNNSRGIRAIRSILIVANTMSSP